MKFKLITFLMGLSFLLYGALSFGIQDWDVGVSLVLSTYTLLTAEWAVVSIWDKEYPKYPIAFLSILVAPYSLYIFYWAIQGNDKMIPGQMMMVICCYLICGITWAYYQKRHVELDSILGKMVGYVRGQHP